MALIKLSAGYSEIKGVMGGTIFQGYRGSTVMKTRLSGGGRDSDIWQQRRALMASTTTQWKTLSIANQNLWIAAAPAFPYIDKFGNPQIPSGFQLFTTLNYFNLNAGNPLLLVPPAPAVKASIGAVTVTWLDPANVNVTWINPGIPTIGISIQSTYPGSKGITVPPSRSRFTKFVNSGAAQPVNIAPEMTALYGTLPQSGRLWINVYQLSTTSWEKWNLFTAFSDL